jgi:diguanylate cyclase (GGDEF)-like protein
MHPTIHRGARREQRVATRGRRLWGLGLAALALALLLGTLATTIVRSRSEARSHLESNFRLRGQSTATLVATYLSQQALHQKDSAERFLSGRAVDGKSFEVVARAFGSDAAVLLDAHGRVLKSVPQDQALRGSRLAGAYPNLALAERGGVAISNALASPGLKESVTAIAVPFQTPTGRRVLSIAYGVRSADLGVFVNHAITYPQHEVVLLDGGEKLLAASPRLGTGALRQVDPALARAASHASHGPVPGARAPSSFTSAAVPGTHWRVVLSVPDSKLFSSIGGLASVIPWAVFAIVTLFSGLLMVLFARLLADRARLGALSRELSRMARTDTLTGLLNRRGLNDYLTRATAHARRRNEPLSVLMIDLDRFKQVNDHYGHDAGDRVLCTLADCMRDVLRAEDVYGRIGGDEFMVILASANEEAAQAATARLYHAVRQVDLSDVGLPDGIPMSVGAATAIVTHPDEIQRAADVELYRVKGAKRAHPEPSPGPRADTAGRALPRPANAGTASSLT